MPQTFSIWRRAAAYGVHLFTSSGIVAALLAILAIHRHDWQWAMWWLWACFAIDGFDGLLARAVRVREVLPNWDGKTIDYVIDFCTYAVIPAFFMYEASYPSGVPMLPEAWRLPVAALVLLTSAMYYGKMGMVSDDHYFVGFPVLWNFVIFYQFFVFQLSPFGNVATTVVLCVLHFVPIKVPYPSQSNRRFRVFNMLFITAMVSACIMTLYSYPVCQPVWRWVSLLGLGYLAAWTVVANRHTADKSSEN